MAVGSNLGTVIDPEEGAVKSIPGNVGRIAQAWVTVKERCASLRRLLLAFRGLDSEKGGLLGNSGKTREFHEAPVVDGV